MGLDCSIVGLHGAAAHVCGRHLLVLGGVSDATACSARGYFVRTGAGGFRGVIRELALHYHSLPAIIPIGSSDARQQPFRVVRGRQPTLNRCARSPLKIHTSHCFSWQLLTREGARGRELSNRNNDDRRHSIMKSACNRCQVHLLQLNRRPRVLPRTSRTRTKNNGEVI
jgi:hypothetical protein